MLHASDLATALDRRGFGPYLGVPCSFLQPLINYLIDRRPGEYLPLNNEGESVAVAAGAYLAGRLPVVLFQNSGLGNAVSPLTSLNQVFRIPALLMTTWRGQPGHADEPQHECMGRMTEPLLDLMGIPHAHLPRSTDGLDACLDAAAKHLLAARTPFALIVCKDTLVANVSRSERARRHRPAGATARTDPDAGTRVLRRDAIRTIVASAPATTLTIATTGKTARELHELHDRDTNLYVVGSMGCASSIGLGVALYRPERRVLVIDGDGAALMRLEALASIGHFGPPNLTHVILDNEAYESTGGQPTQSPTVNFSQIAIGCGYRDAWSGDALDRLASVVREQHATEGPGLIHFRVKTGSDPSLTRPSLAPSAVATRFRDAVNGVVSQEIS